MIWLLEELGCEYKIEIVPIVRGDGSGEPAPDSYLAIHPLKKVPAMKIFDEVILSPARSACILTKDSSPKKDIGPCRSLDGRAGSVPWLFFFESARARTRGRSTLPGLARTRRAWTGFGEFEDIEGLHLAGSWRAPTCMLGDNFSAGLTSSTVPRSSSSRVRCFRRASIMTTISPGSPRGRPISARRPARTANRARSISPGA